jgi:hypothetical protein
MLNMNLGEQSHKLYSVLVLCLVGAYAITNS